MPLIRQIESISNNLIPERFNIAPSAELKKAIKFSRNSSNRLGNYNSTTSLRKIRTSQAKHGELTSRGSIFRPTTGLGLVSESTNGSQTSRSNFLKFSKRSQKVGFKFQNQAQFNTKN